MALAPPRSCNYHFPVISIQNLLKLPMFTTKWEFLIKLQKKITEKQTFSKVTSCWWLWRVYFLVVVESRSESDAEHYRPLFCSLRLCSLAALNFERQYLCHLALLTIRVVSIPLHLCVSDVMTWADLLALGNGRFSLQRSNTHGKY